VMTALSSVLQATHTFSWDSTSYNTSLETVATSAIGTAYT